MGEVKLREVDKRIISLSQAVKIAKRARGKGLRVVTTNGAFDLIHAGHVRSLSLAKAYGDILIVGVNSDASVRQSKGSLRPIVTARERARMVAALRPVDYVFVFASKTPVSWITKIRPHVHAKGSDRAVAEIVEGSAVEKYGGRVVRLPHAGEPSTTQLIQRIIRLYRGRYPESK